LEKQKQEFDNQIVKGQQLVSPFGGFWKKMLIHFYH